MVSKTEVAEAISELRAAAASLLFHQEFDSAILYAKTANQLEAWLGRGLDGDSPVDLTQVRKWLAASRVSRGVDDDSPDRSLTEPNARDAAQYLSQARSLAQEGKLRHAINMLARASRMSPNDPVIQDFSMELKAQLQSRISESMQEAVAILNVDAEQAYTLFNRILDDLDPENPEARVYLGRIARMREEDLVTRELRRAKSLIKSHLLSNIENALTILRQLRVQFTDNSEITALLANAEEERTEIRSRFNVIETHRAAQNYKQAISELEQLVAEGVREYVRPNDSQLVPSEQELSRVRDEYRIYCGRKANERYEEAKALLPQAPLAARERLDDALNTLEMIPLDDKTKLELELARIKEEVRHWQEADQAVRDGIEILFSDPNKALQQFTKAKAHYPAYKGIDELLSEAQKRIAEIFLLQAQDAHFKAQVESQIPNFANARGECLRAEYLLLRVVPPVNEFITLSQQVQGLLENIATAERQRQERQEAAQKLREKAEEIRKQVEEGQLSLAQELIKRLDPEDRKDLQIDALDVRIHLQNQDQEKLRKARTELYSGNWDQAIQLAEAISEDRFRQDALRLIQQARASRAFEDGERAIAGYQWEAAERAFRQVISLEGEQVELARKKQSEIAAMRVRETEIRYALEQAKHWTSKGIFANAWQVLQPYRMQDSAVQHEISEMTNLIREEWSGVLRIQINDSMERGDFKEALRLAEILNHKLGSWEWSDKRLLQRASVQYFIWLGDAYRETRRWSDACSAYDRALAIEPENPESLSKAQHAKKAIILEQARDAWWVGGDSDRAIQILETGRSHGLDRDVDLLLELASISINRDDADLKAAKQYCQRAKVMDPDNEQVQKILTSIRGREEE